MAVEANCLVVAWCGSSHLDLFSPTFLKINLGTCIPIAPHKFNDLRDIWDKKYAKKVKKIKEKLQFSEGGKSERGPKIIKRQSINIKHSIYFNEYNFTYNSHSFFLLKIEYNIVE